MRIDCPIERAKELFRVHGGILRTAEALSFGIHPRTFYALRDSGQIVRLSCGLFRLSKLPKTKAHDLAIAAATIPKGVVCLVSALSFYKITPQIPQQVNIALPKGVEVHQIDGVAVKIYSASRSVVDCFKFRNKIGLDIAVEALRQCLKRRKATPAEIMKQARICRVERVIRPYLESLAY